MSKRRAGKALFSLSPVQYRDSPIAGRGVFARRSFAPGDVIVPYAPRQRRLPADDPEAATASGTKLTLLSGSGWVILPDTSVPGGWLCNHSCHPNADLYSSGEGRIQCVRPVAPGEEITIFYGWVSQNEPGRDPCRCGNEGCRGAINFDLTSTEAADHGADTPAGEAVRRRIEDYAEFLRSIGQEHVLGAIAARLAAMRV